MVFHGRRKRDAAAAGSALEVEGVLRAVISPDAIERRVVFMSRELYR